MSISDNECSFSGKASFRLHENSSCWTMISIENQEGEDDDDDNNDVLVVVGNGSSCGGVVSEC